MISNEAVQGFLAGRRIAVVGASDEKSNFGRTIYRELREHGYDAVAVNPGAAEVAGDPCYPAVAAVPAPPLDGVIVMVNAQAALEVIDQCAVAGVPRVWLFRGLGKPGAVSDEAVARCAEHGMEVVAGACPLMFLEPVGWFHRAHRAIRRHRGLLARAA